MSDTNTPYSRLERVIALLDFSWVRTEQLVDKIAEFGVPMNRFRPGGPHGLWIVGHLAFVEAGAVARYTGGENPLADWKDLFGNGSSTMDDADHYAPFADIVAKFKSVRAEFHSFVEGLSETELDRTDLFSDHLPVQDLQSHIQFMIWHDSHHLAQLQAIVNEVEG